jgi:hypothetical protein
MRLVRSCVVATLIGCITLTGCTRGVRQDLASHAYSSEVTVEPVRKRAEYWVRARVPGDEKFREVPGTRRYMHPGDVVGFETDDVGQVVMVHNGFTKVLDVPPGTDVNWHAKYRRQTQFGREMDKLARGLGEAGQAAFLGAAVVGVAAFVGWSAWKFIDDPKYRERVLADDSESRR